MTDVSHSGASGSEQPTAEVSPTANTVLQHRTPHHCHHPSCVPDLRNHTDKSHYSAYYWKRTELSALPEIMVHQHFPPCDTPFAKVKVPCLYSFPAGSLNRNQREKLVFQCSKLNARPAGIDFTCREERVSTIKPLLHSYISGSSRKLSKRDTAITVAQLPY